MVSHVIFDLDGTLVDSRRDIAISVNHMLAGYGLATLPLDVIESYVGSGARRLVRSALGTEAAGFDIDECVKVFRAHYLDHCLDTTRAFPGIAALLAALKGRGLSLAVVTNKPTAMSRRILEGLGLRAFFDVVIGGDDDATMKPDPSPAAAVFARTGGSPVTTLMVGDSTIDLGFARAVGMKCVLVGFGGISDTAELRAAGAEWFCETPEALVALLLRVPIL